MKTAPSYVLLDFDFFARRGEFRLRLRRSVGQDGILRAIGNRAGRLSWEGAVK